MADARANFATSLVATAPSPATSGTSLVVTGGEGARFPTAPFNAVVCPADQQPTSANAEIVRVTARATDTLTITRTQESTSARTVVVGDRIYAGPTKASLDTTDAEALAYFNASIAKTFFSAKGDLIGASANDTPALVSVGANETVLTADSSQSTGMRWGTPRYIPVLTQVGAIPASTGAQNRWFDAAGVMANTGAGTAAARPFLVFDATDWPGFTVMNLQVSLTTTATQTGVTFTFGLRPVANTGTTTTIPTLASAVTGSNVAIAAPAAAAETRANSTDFSLPATDFYMIACANNATTVAASLVQFTAVLRLG